MTAAVAEAWWLATATIAGTAAGALGLLLLGRLLGRRWVTPIEDELDPAARTLPLVLLLFAPLLFLPPLPWPTGSGWLDPNWLVVRAFLYVALWCAIVLLASRFTGRVAAAGGLALLLPTASLAGMDWVLARDPSWTPGLFGFAFAVSQLAPALGLAFLANALQREHVGRLHDRSLTSALLTLAIAVPGLWFVQFLAAWMGDLPEEAAWYLARLDGGRWIPLALAAAMAAAAALLLVQRHRGDWTVVAAAALLVHQHPLHMAWLLRPAGTPPLGLSDAAALIVLGGAWLLAWWTLMARHDRRLAQSGRPGSS